MRNIVIVMLSLLMVGCGVRKVTTDTQKEGFKSNTKDSISIDKSSIERKIDTSTLIYTIYEPIDKKNEMLIDGKVYKNIRFKTFKIRKGIDSSKIENSRLNVTKVINTDILKEKNKTIKEVISIRWWWWILIILLIIIIIKIYRNYER